jgi:hypothetical protein
MVLPAGRQIGCRRRHAGAEDRAGNVREPSSGCRKSRQPLASCQRAPLGFEAPGAGRFSAVDFSALRVFLGSDASVLYHRWLQVEIFPPTPAPSSRAKRARPGGLDAGAQRRPALSRQVADALGDYGRARCLEERLSVPEIEPHAARNEQQHDQSDATIGAK